MIFFLKVPESVDSLNWYGSLLLIQKASQKNIIDLLLKLDRLLWLQPLHITMAV